MDTATDGQPHFCSGKEGRTRHCNWQRKEDREDSTWQIDVESRGRRQEMVRSLATYRRAR